MTENAKTLLKSLISKYKSGQRKFDMCDCCQFSDWEKLVIELHNNGYVYYDDRCVAESITLTDTGIIFNG